MRYLRNAPTRKESMGAALIAGALAAGVGVVAFYFTRLLLAREPLPEARAEEAKEKEGE